MVEIVSNFGVLLRLACDLGKAKKLGNQEDIDKAQKAHDEYKKICLLSDKMTI